MTVFQIKLTQYDEENPQGNVIADGEGYRSEDTLYYREKDNPAIRHEILMRTDGLVMKRLADIRSVTELKKDEAGKATVFSPYGNMELETCLLDFGVEDDRIVAEYVILQNKMPVTRQRLVWEWKGIPE